MSLSCKINMCKRQCCALCYCCNKNICFNHLKEHRDLINSQLNPLANEINILNEELIAFNVQILNNQYFVKQINKLQENISELQTRICQLIIEQDTTNEDIILLTLSIYGIKQKTSFIKQSNGNLTFSSPIETIVCTYPLGSALASNNQRLLMDQRFSLQLFNQDLTLEKQYQWKYGLIRHMCWSSTLNYFIITNNNKQIYLVNETLTSIERIHAIEEEDWCSCACSDKSLFLITNNRATNIFEFNLSSSFEFIQQWKPSDSCLEHERIHNIVYNNGKLALVIEDCFSNQMHIELRSSTNLDFIWSLRLDIKCNLFQPILRCCSLKHDEWFVMDSKNSQLIHINKHGIIKDSHVYKSSPWNAVLFHSNVMAIRTENSLNFHQIY